MKRRLAWAVLGVGILTAGAASATPGPQKPRGVRAAAQAAKTTVVEGVIIKGRPARPLVVTEIPRAEMRFEVGTTHYGLQPRRLPRR